MRKSKQALSESNVAFDVADVGVPPATGLSSPPKVGQATVFARVFGFAAADQIESRLPSRTVHALSARCLFR